MVDAAMTEGAALLSAMFFNDGALAGAQAPRGGNMLGGAAPFYDAYETADGKFVALAAVEPPFHALLLDRLGLAGDPDLVDQKDRSRWAAGKAKIAAVIRSRTRDDWCALLEGSDACFAPVLSRAEAPDHPHNRARGTFVEAFGLVQPAPAPRYSVNATRPPTLSADSGDVEVLLIEAGYSADQVCDLLRRGIVAGRSTSPIS